MFLCFQRLSQALGLKLLPRKPMTTIIVAEECNKEEDGSGVGSINAEQRQRQQMLDRELILLQQQRELQGRRWHQVEHRARVGRSWNTATQLAVLVWAHRSATCDLPPSHLLTFRLSRTLCEDMG